MARASRGEPWEKAKSPFATRLLTLMNKQPITTQAQLAEITGKTRQTISQYVNGISEPGYDTLVKIADHFRVSVDYLIGRTADPKVLPSSVDELGLSPEVVEWIKEISHRSHFDDIDDQIAVLNILLGDFKFHILFYNLCEYFYACRASALYDTLFNSVFPPENELYGSDSLIGSEKIHEFNNKITDIVGSCSLPHEIRGYLLSVIELVNESVDGTSSIVNTIEGIEGFQISDIPELRVNKNFFSLMEAIKQHAENQQPSDILPHNVIEGVMKLHGNH